MALRSGPTGTPIPCKTLVMRVCRPANMDADQGRAHPAAFEFNSGDMAQQPPKLSVFAKGLTTVQQAKDFVQGAGTDATIVYLRVDDVRNVPAPTNCSKLDVVWDEKTEKDATGNVVRSTAAGAAGHCGIINAYVSGIPDSKKYRLRFRDELARISSVKPSENRFWALALCVFELAVKVWGRLISNLKT